MPPFRPSLRLVAPAVLALAVIAVAAPAQAAPHAASGAASGAHRAKGAKAAPAGPAASAPLGQARIDKLNNKGKKPPKPEKLVDINHASASELKTLPGIGDAEAGRIISGRPYHSKAELVSKNVLPTGPYLSLRTRIIALQKDVPPPQRPAPAAIKSKG